MPRVLGMTGGRTASRRAMSAGAVVTTIPLAPRSGCQASRGRAPLELCGERPSVGPGGMRPNGSGRSARDRAGLHVARGAVWFATARRWYSTSPSSPRSGRRSSGPSGKGTGRNSTSPSGLIVHGWEWALRHLSDLEVPALIVDVHGKGGGVGSLPPFFAGSFYRDAFDLFELLFADETGSFGEAARRGSAGRAAPGSRPAAPPGKDCRARRRHRGTGVRVDGGRRQPAGRGPAPR